MRVIDFGANEAAAVKHARALGRSRIYTTGGAPPLPRCDNPKWTGSWQSRGRQPTCTCVARDQPRRGCPFLTAAHVAAEELGGRYLVPVTAEHALARGESVDVGGTAVVIDDSGARDLTRDELTSRNGSRIEIWSGDPIP